MARRAATSLAASATRATSTSSGPGGEPCSSTSASGDVLDRWTSSGSSASPTCSSPTTTATSVQGLARAADAGHPGLGAARRGRADRRHRRALAARAARERLRPARGPLLAARVRSRRRAPSPSTARARYGDFEVYALPTPGHTIGSVTLSRRARRAAARVHRRPRLRRRQGLVARGDAVDVQRARGPGGDDRLGVGARRSRARRAAARRTASRSRSRRRRSRRSRERMQRLIDLRDPQRLGRRRAPARMPFEPITPHLLRNRTMFATSYALLSETGAALLIDFGYDVTATADSTERPARRTLLWSLDGLRRDHGVERIDARSCPTTTTTTSPASTCSATSRARRSGRPRTSRRCSSSRTRYDLPCLWFDPIPVDRVLPFERAVPRGTSTS